MKRRSFIGWVGTLLLSPFAPLRGLPPAKASGIAPHAQGAMLANGGKPDSPNEGGAIRFFTGGGAERLRICADGRFFVNGRLAATDRQVYESFKEWVMNGKEHGA